MPDPGPEALREWLQEVVALCQPQSVHFCTGEEGEYQALCKKLVDEGVFTPLNQRLRPGSFLARSHPQDVARSEQATYICSKEACNSGPTNQWREPQMMREELKKEFSKVMRGRTLYVIPFALAPQGACLRRYGVQLTDSAYVAISMRIITSMGESIYPLLGSGFVRCLHSLGVPLEDGAVSKGWVCAPEKKCIAHFPETGEVWSLGSGYGGNALLSKKSFALRIGSVMARQEGWLAEHMLILGITAPSGEKKYMAAAFPSSCGKTNLATLTPTLPGWRVECVSDDIAWMYFNEEGELRAMNPERGFFGVAPGLSERSNPVIMEMLRSDTIFTNVGLTKEGDVWWEGMQQSPPDGVMRWHSESKTVAHPNARFTTSLTRCPLLDPNWEDPRGVPISAILFGGRRSSAVPLVLQAFDWRHGIFLGATLSSEMTSATEGGNRSVRFDPFAMRPFCGYHMGDYFTHWLQLPQHYPYAKLPGFFYVNWFRKSPQGDYLWPGFGENIRVLKWIFERVENRADVLESPLGLLPEALELDDLQLSDEIRAQLWRVDPREWFEEVAQIEEFFHSLGEELPQALTDQLLRLKKRLGMVIR